MAEVITRDHGTIAHPGYKTVFFILLKYIGTQRCSDADY